ncbi:MAG: hypothetical protein J5989_03880 [Alistipes sp.]|nr:hypothetical protein [Alistipes sp.]
MRKIILGVLAAVILVGCESECDKMSEYDKVIHDVGISSEVSADDALKNVEVWWAAKIIYSTEPCGNGEVHVIDNEKVAYYGGRKYFFSYGSKFRLFVCNGPKITMYDKGVDNPYVIHQSYYAEYGYNLNADNSITTNVTKEFDDLLKKYGISINKMHLIAYNESCIVVEICFNTNYEYKYVTYVLKPTTMTLDEMGYIDIATFDKQ